MDGTDLLKRYLLDDVSGEEQARIEDEYFSEAGRFEELVATENDLIDCAVRGALSDSEQQQFKHKYSYSPRRRARVQFAQSLNEIIQQSKKPKVNEGGSQLRPFERIVGGEGFWSRFALMAAGLPVVVVALWLSTQNRKLKFELHQAQTTIVELHRNQDAVAQQLARPSNAAKIADTEQPTKVAKVNRPYLPGESLSLSPGILRGGDQAQPTLFLPLHGSSLQLKLILEQDQREYDTYNVVVRTAEGVDLFSSTTGFQLVRQADEKAAMLRMPAKLIQPGDYIVTLYGTRVGKREEVRSYVFQARKH